MCSISEMSKTSRSEPVFSTFAYRFALVVYSVAGLDDLEIPVPEVSLIFCIVVVVPGLTDY